MAVGFYTLKHKTDNTNFVVRNTSDRQIKVFTIKMMPGATYDLMDIPFVSEADIKASLLKGELRSALELGKIQIVESSISLVQYGSDFISYMEGITDLQTMGLRDKFAEKEIRTLRDLPDPVNGVITLDQDNAQYYIFGLVDLKGNRILSTGQNISLLGRSARTDALVSSVADGNLFETTRGVQLENVSFINPDGYAICLDGAGTDHIMVTLCGLLFSKYAGTIKNALVLHAKSLMVKGCDNGLNLLSSGYVSFSDFSATTNHSLFGIGLQIPPNQTFENILFRDSIIKAISTQTGLYIDPSTNITNKAVFNNNVIYGGGTPLAGITKKETKFWFRNNSGILDSQAVGGAYFSGNASETVISTPGEFVEIGTGSTSPPHASFLEDNANERVSLIGNFPNQEIRYDGYEERTFVLTVSLSAYTVAAAEKLAAVRVFLNDNFISDSEFRFVSKGAGSASYSFVLTLQHADTIKVKIANLDDSTNLIVYSARITLMSS